MNQQSPTGRVIQLHVPNQQLSKTSAEAKAVAAAFKRPITGRLTFCSDPIDVTWLRETHLAHVQDLPEFKSFELEGNEDSPERLFLYAERFPSVFDVTLRVFVMDSTGTLV